MLLSLWRRTFYFSLSRPFKFGREHCCIIVRQMDAVVLDAWRQLVSGADTANSAEFWTWTAESLWWRTFFVSLGDVFVRGGSWGCRIICLVGPGFSIIFCTNSNTPVLIMGLVSTYLASFFLFYQLRFK